MAFVSLWQQVFAVFIKKLKITKRDKKFVFFGLLFPLLAAISVVIVKFQLAPSDNNNSIYYPIIIPSSSNLIPFIASPGIDPSSLFPYFPQGSNFKQFPSVDSLNNFLADNSTTYTNIVGGYNFINITDQTFTVSVWFNDSYTRALPALTKTLTQAIYSYKANASIQIDENALDWPSYTKSITNIGIFAPTILQYGIMFLFPYFAISLVIEKEKQQKEILLLNSLSRSAYWIGTYLADYILFWVPNLISLILMWSFKISLFSGSNAGPSFLVVLLTGWAGLPFVYLLSFIFDKEETANKWIYSTISIIGGIPVALTAVLGNKHAAQIDYLSFIPAFGYFRGLSDIESGFSYTIPCVLLFVDGIIYWAIILLIDFKFFSRFKKINTPFFTRVQEDDDVIRERESVLHSMNQHDDAINVKEVVKSYDNKFVAVKGVSFRVKSGECFGLLGPNGAGKTSILGVMIGATDADSGESICEFSDKNKVQGVCPQFDVLWDLLSAREHLSIYGRIKGLVGKELELAIEESLDLFGLKEYADQNSAGYSGGTKRKLCSAISLLANPHIVFMDEPSTGMDPVTRRMLWNVIEQKKHGRVLILTTHSMEEAEALCTRVGIMVKGQLRCIGSPQHLRNKYGSGYRLTINTPVANSERVSKWVNERYTSRSQMAVGGVLNFDIQQGSFEIHKIFQDIEEVKNELAIVDYCLSQTSLEQVFLRFALEQEDEVEEDDTTTKI